jgi:ornithine cyclodeaminase
LGIKSIRLYDLDPEATKKAAHNLAGRGLEIISCASAQEAVASAQIITTCTADKQYATILSDNMIGAGVHINAIGGDCPGKTELHKDILLRSDIFVEYPPQTRIEGELWQVMSGASAGRKSPDQITLFDSVGFATEDFSALRYLRKQIMETGLYEQLDMIADPNDPRDLFGMITRAKVA